MGINLRDYPEIDGYDWALVQAVLDEMGREKGPLALAERKKPLDEFEIVGAIEACVDAGLASDSGWLDRERVWRGRFSTTEKGDCILGAHLRKRIPRAAAMRILGELLDRCAAVNKDHELPSYVSEVWLAGSLAKGAAEVGDIDIAIDWQRREWTRTLGTGEWDRRIWRLAHERNLPASAFEVPACYGLSHRLCTMALFGKRRNPALQILELSTLISMHDVCQCVFDAKRGGIVRDPVLPHHPGSNKRGEEMLDPRTMPAIPAPAEMKPSHASWLRRYDAYFDDRLPPMLHNTEYYWPGRGKRWAAVHAGHVNEAFRGWIPEAELNALDGRERAVLAVAPGYEWNIQKAHIAQAAYVTRSFSLAGAPALTIGISMRKLGDRDVEPGHRFELALMIAGLIAIDTWRLARRAGSRRVAVALTDESGELGAGVNVQMMADALVDGRHGIDWRMDAGLAETIAPAAKRKPRSGRRKAAQ